MEREHLHVVVQNGRLFQQENPDARLLVDRVQPLRENEVVFDLRERGSERAAPVAWIQDLVDKVSHSTL